MHLQRPSQSDLSGVDALAEFRQLRHQTKNALARIIVHVSRHLAEGDPARALARELERRIILSAEISDALFGLTQAPGRLEDRLRSLCLGIVDLFSDPDQEIRFELIHASPIPRPLHDLVMRITHELVANAVKHGMHMRLVGRICVTVAATAEGTTVSVADDGWGCPPQSQPGEGLRLAHLIAGPYGGTVTLRQQDGFSVATLWIPEP